MNEFESFPMHEAATSSFDDGKDRSPTAKDIASQFLKDHEEYIAMIREMQEAGRQSNRLLNSPIIRGRKGGLSNNSDTRFTTVHAEVGNPDLQLFLGKPLQLLK